MIRIFQTKEIDFNGKILSKNIYLTPVIVYHKCEYYANVFKFWNPFSATAQ